MAGGHGPDFSPKLRRLVAGDGLWGLAIPVEPAERAKVLLEMGVTEGGVAAGPVWPYLTVR